MYRTYLYRSTRKTALSENGDRSSVELCTVHNWVTALSNERNMYRTYQALNRTIAPETP